MKNQKNTNAKRSATNNPYQILIFAVPFFVAGTMMLIQHGQAGMIGDVGGKRVPNSFQILTISEGTIHTLGVILLLLGFAITCFDFHLRKLIKRDNLAPHSRNA